MLESPHASSETIEEGTVVAQSILFRSCSTAGLAAGGATAATMLESPHASTETIEEGTVVAQSILFRSCSTAGLAGLKEDRQGDNYVQRYLLAVYLHGATRPIRRL
jgi:hypothetical protein